MKVCSVEGCEMQSKCKGMCWVHFSRERRRLKSKPLTPWESVRELARLNPDNGQLLAEPLLDGGLLRNIGVATHRMSDLQIYKRWRAIMDRCLRPSYHAFPDYGGRGIRICVRWLHFEHFISDMGVPPKGMEIDRIDNNGHYTPQNCRWATRKQQARNVRTNRILTFNGKSQPMAAWAEDIGIKSSTLHARLKSGWSVETALTKPLLGGAT